ncbi:RNB-domain-containing protein [Piromyces finnis]|uniref:RNB-domain-containing protein n=1 Tax=Piromyces finnis TaxID=1754191 RepID=A0A1Y1UY73_9FUNG|nr:RNB-domain-containing protein [Piromyces finnis]|eukprot:ORX43377.1 RNB-domain-containing protein [Piromyces finnis]
MNKNNSKRNNYYRDFYPENIVKEKLRKKELEEGILEYNEKRGEWLIVSEENKKIIIKTENECNRAIVGDKVVVECNPTNKRFGRVVFIDNPSYKTKIFEGKIVNEIRNENKRSNNSLFFIPYDKNVPYFEIKFDSIDKKVLSLNDFKKNYDSFKDNKCEARIKDWNSRFRNPLGELIKVLSTGHSDHSYGNNIKDFNRSNRNSEKENSGGLVISLTTEKDGNTIRRVNSTSNFDKSTKQLRNSKSSRNLKVSKSSSRLKDFKSYSYYERFWTQNNVTKGLKDKTLYEGKLIIKDFKTNDSYVLINNNNDKIYIKTDVYRNRGLDGDKVILKILNTNESEKTGKVIFIENPLYRNMEVNGKIIIEVESNKNEKETKFYLCPRDRKLPKIEIPRRNIPKDVLSINEYFKDPNKYKSMYNFSAIITQWSEDDKNPIGKLTKYNEESSDEILKIIEEIKLSDPKSSFKNAKIKLKIDSKNSDDYFEKYYPKELVAYGIESKNLFKGKVDIPRHIKDKDVECFVNLYDADEKIIIENKKYRNRSMHDDEVIIEIIDNSSKPKKGKVVYIENPVYFNDMKIPGVVQYKEGNKKILSFRPDDKRIPLIDIPVSSVKKDLLDVDHFIKNYDEYKDNYYNAKIIRYGSHRYYPLGELVEKNDSIKRNDYYSKYLTQEEVEEGLANGTLYEGIIRVNSKNGNESYVTVAGMDNDVRITSVKLRNRALDNDIVVIKLLEGEELKLSENDIYVKKETNMEKDEEMFQKFFTKGVKLNDYIKEKNNPLGKVVYVRNSKAKNIDIVGKFKFDSDRDYLKDERLVFYPNDKGIPLIDIFTKDIDPEIFNIKDFIENHEKYENDMLIVARIIKWNETKCYPLGKIVSKLTDEHTIDSRTKMILKTYNIDDSAFYDIITNEIPNNDWQIPEEEIKNRLDLRKECVFTIDPPTAKDLDDALSCKRLDDGNYEVGIHIADVSYFVNPDSNMDKEAFKRGTSTYLVQKVIPMLPKVLCENLCSLNAGGSRLAFSVIIKIDKNGNILESKAVKSIICSCSKLAYENAQRVIDNNGKWPAENNNVVINNPYHNYTAQDICERINDLYRISRILKEERYANGAVSLNRKKLWFQLNQDDELPLDFGIYETREANSLVEEFMLLANTTVANMLYEKYSDESLLRCHEAPTKDNIKKYLALIEFTKKIVIDTSDSKAFHDSLLAIKEAGSIYTDVALSKCIKFMKRANYICSSRDRPNELFHYGLHIPLYTHFTSPIRRYPDIIVHRQLQAILCNQNSPYTSKQIKVIAKHSNDTKANAKKAQDDSNNLYLIYLLSDYIKKTGKEYIVDDALVIGFDNYYIEFTLPRFAYEDKISINQLYDKGIVKGVSISKPSSIDNEGEITFNVYWRDDVAIDNILEKYNAETSKDLDDFEESIKKNTSIDSFDNIDDNKQIDLEEIIKKNTSIDSFDSIDDEDFDSDEALEQAVAEVIAAAQNNNETDEEKMEKKKQELSKYRCQSFKIFDSFKVIIIPNFEKMKINVIIAPPDINNCDISTETYKSQLEKSNNDSIVVFEPEGGYD